MKKSHWQRLRRWMSEFMFPVARIRDDRWSILWIRAHHLLRAWNWGIWCVFVCVYAVYTSICWAIHCKNISFRLGWAKIYVRSEHSYFPLYEHKKVIKFIPNITQLANFKILPNRYGNSSVSVNIHAFCYLSISTKMVCNRKHCLAAYALKLQRNHNSNKHVTS